MSGVDSKWLVRVIKASAEEFKASVECALIFYSGVKLDNFIIFALDYCDKQIKLYEDAGKDLYVEGIKASREKILSAQKLLRGDLSAFALDVYERIR